MAKKNDEKKLAGVKFVTPVFRCSFAHVFEPHKAPKAEKAKYSVTMLYPKDGKPEKALGGLTPRQFLNKMLNKAAAECWGTDKEKWPKIERPFRDGDEKADYQGYEGHMYCVADTLEGRAPGVIDRKLNDIVDKSEFYSGCYARASVTAKAVPDVGGKNFVKFYLNHVMFWEDGDAFGSAGNAKDAFAEFGEPDDDDDDGGDEDENYDLEA